MNEEKRSKEDNLKYEIVGKSRTVENLKKQIGKLAKSTNDLVITGEAGTGKSAIAKNVHHLSQVPGEEKPFAAINLSVIDDKDLETALFGYSRGLVGESSNAKRGLLEMVNGGTLLMEELEEASLRTQMKVLSFMNERTVGRIGTERKEPINVRLIVTVKEDLKELFEKRKLLEELYKKMQTFERIDVPPLREHPEDIPLLVKHFTKELCKELGIGELVIDINAIDVLVRQPWKENIRELKAVVDKSVLFSTQGRFVLPPELVDEKTEVVKMIANIESGQDFVLDKSLDLIEKGIIERALNRFGFNQSRAANFLGMTEQTLRYKLKRLGIVSARARTSA
jgi:DNA-binding NtrC family response regulator